MKNNQKIIFSNSYSPRTGHNFVAQVFKIFTGLEILIHDKSETQLSRILDLYYTHTRRYIYLDSDKKFMDHLFINGLRERILSKSDNSYVLIKDTSFQGVDCLPELFPNDIHILLIRDPKDVLTSGFKAMRFKRKSIKNLIKKIGMKTGLFQLYFSWRVTHQVIDILPNLENRILIRYEDLVIQKEETLQYLKELFNCDKALDDIKAEINEISVINTSFFKEETGGKHIWDEKEKTTKFNPVNRKSKNIFYRKAIEWGTRDLRKKLGYV
ncbi:sulfotransferase [Formosa sediminum]|uniref:Sulfotransferase n=1 Tax=Formosa sediminum TaxID=2594004 RepID=A0A516GRN4_9FLAO|nr:sulfotransferase [Formosa sediminum]QDO94181.1 sulfotransferase [Formosa sediminum]